MSWASHEQAFEKAGVGSAPQVKSACVPCPSCWLARMQRSGHEYEDPQGRKGNTWGMNSVKGNG